MKENFDASQFITFDLIDKSEEIIRQIHKRFSMLGFLVLQEDEIRNVKKQYFSQYRKKVFIELKDETFLGEIESWKVLSEEPNERIKTFAEQLNWLLLQNEIDNLTLILTGFAEPEFTSNTVIKVNSMEILNGISTMSKYYFDVWTDNLIMNIVK